MLQLEGIVVAPRVADPKHGDEWTRVSKDVEHGLAQLSCDAALKRVAANLALGKSASGS